MLTILRQFLAGTIHQRTHAPNGGGEAAEDGFPDEKVTDVELDYLRQAGNCANGIECKPVAGMHLEAGSIGKVRRRSNARACRWRWRGNRRIARSARSRRSPRP